MALIPGGALEIIGLNGDLFSNTLTNDFIIRTTQSNQRLLLGNLGVSNASVILSGSNVGINKSPIVGLDVNGDLSVSGYSLFQSNILVSGHIFPRSNEIYDIGSSNTRFRDLFLSGNTLDIGGVKIKRNEEGTSITILDSNNSVASTTQSMLTLSNYGVGRIMTSNGYIGINNSNPTRALDVQGDINFNGQLFQNNQPFIGSRWSSNNTGSNISYSAGRVVIGSNIFPELFSVVNGNIFGGSNAYVMQRLGVASSNPTESLDVRGNMKISSNIFALSRFAIGSSNPLVSIDVSASDAIMVPKGTTAERPSAIPGYIRYNTTLNILETCGVGNIWSILASSRDSNLDTYITYEMGPGVNDDIIRFYNSNVETVRITKDGAMGISNQTPSEKLDVSGNVKAASNVYAMNRLGVGTSNPIAALDVAGDINFSGALYKNNQPFIGSRWSSNNTGSNIYYTSGRVAIGASNFNEIFNIHGGNVYVSSNVYAMNRLGVGTSNPVAALDVAGDINLTGQLLLNNQLFSGSRWSLSNSNIFYPAGSVTIGASPLSEKFNVSGGSMYVSHNAYIMSNVGVGKSNPTYAMDVNGDINFTGRFLQNGFQFATGGITSNELVRRFQVAPLTLTQIISSDMSNASFVLSTGGTFQALPQNAQINLNGTKLVYINSNQKDYDIAIAYPNLYSTEFTLTLSQPVFSGDIVDITIWPYIPNLNGIFVKNLDFASNIQFSNVGIGLPAPSNPLHAYNVGLSNWLANFQNSNVQTLISHSDGMGMKISTNSDTSNARAVFECINGSNVILHVRNNGVVGIGTSNIDSTYALNVQGSVNATGEVSSSSDIRLKTNIEKITNALSNLAKLNGYRFTFKDDADTKHIGLIAQEVQEIFPEVVFENSEGYLSVAYGNIVALLIESVKEQQEQINDLKKLIT